jgi:hypothetical protein
MTRDLKRFDSLTKRDFDNGAVLDEIAKVFKERDQNAVVMNDLAAALIMFKRSNENCFCDRYYDPSCGHQDRCLAVRTVLAGFVIQVTKAAEHGLMCDTCKEHQGVPRTDKGIPAGIHCDDCWKKLVDDARARSW